MKERTLFIKVGPEKSFCNFVIDTEEDVLYSYENFFLSNLTESIEVAKKNFDINKIILVGAQVYAEGIKEKILTAFPQMDVEIEDDKND